MIDKDKELIVDKDIKIESPSQVLSINEQCKQLHGNSSSSCSEFINVLCQSLYCLDSNDECIWIAPAAEYTECDENKWCIQGQCLMKNSNSIEYNEFYDKKDYC